MVGDWIKIHRRLKDHDLWTAEPFTRGQAWVDLLMLANWKDGFVYIRGVRVDLTRGQLVAGSRFLAERWQWSRGKVFRFLNALKQDHRIDQQKTAITTVVTVLNYDSYQGDSTTEQATDQTTDQTTDRTTDGHTRRRNKNDQEETRKKALNEAEKIFKAYPRKIGKAAALTAIEKALKKTSFDELLSAVQEFAKCRDGQDQQFTPYPATWFNQERWHDDRKEWLSTSGRPSKRVVGPGERYDPNHTATL